MFLEHAPFADPSRGNSSIAMAGPVTISIHDSELELSIAALTEAGSDVEPKLQPVALDGEPLRYVVSPMEGLVLVRQ